MDLARPRGLHAVSDVGGTCLRLSCRVEIRPVLALFRELLARLAAGFGFPIERLCDGCRSGHLAEKEHFNLKVAAVVLDLQQVAGADFARGLGRLPVGMNAAEFKGARGQRASLEESRGPEPFVYPHSLLAPGT